MRKELTALKDCEPPLTSAMANVRPCVGRTDPDESGIQSICCLNIPVYEREEHVRHEYSPRDIKFVELRLAGDLLGYHAAPV